MIDGIFEILMLLCFAVAWPFSIHKLYVSKSNGGKSILFSYFVIVGYILGIINKFVMDDVNYVLFFYFFDLALVTIDTLLYYRNKGYEKKGAAGAAL